MKENKAGHNKKAQKQLACIVCGKPAGILELHTPVIKPSGAVGESQYKLRIHVKCL